VRVLNGRARPIGDLAIGELAIGEFGVVFEK
jgi:hypothetical protein